MADGLDVGVACEFKLDLSKCGEIEFQLTVQIDNASGLYRKCLYLAVGKRGIVLLFAGDTLDIDCDDPFIGKHDIVPDCGIGANDGLPLDQEVFDLANFRILSRLSLNSAPFLKSIILYPPFIGRP